jgi:hypothetical protein
MYVGVLSTLASCQLCQSTPSAGISAFIPRQCAVLIDGFCHIVIIRMDMLAAERRRQAYQTRHRFAVHEDVQQGL